jgi:hypothetical protein
MIVYNNRHRRQWWGFTDMGPIQTPANPINLILTDRTTGTQYWVTLNLTTNSSDGFGYIAINSTLPSISRGPYRSIVTYDAFDEPIISNQNGTISRLIIDNGYLGVDVTQINAQQSILNAPPLYLNNDTGLEGFNTELAQIILSISTPGWYSWLPTFIIQTPNPPPYVLTNPPTGL